MPTCARAFPHARSAAADPQSRMLCSLTPNARTHGPPEACTREDAHTWATCICAAHRPRTHAHTRMHERVHERVHERTDACSLGPPAGCLSIAPLHRVASPSPSPAWRARRRKARGEEHQREENQSSWCTCMRMHTHIVTAATVANSWRGDGTNSRLLSASPPSCVPPASRR